MIGWYQVFFASVLVLWLFASQRDRMALWIVIGATIMAELLKYGITIYVTGTWKLAFPAALETLTILALLRWSPNRTGYMQAGCLSVAWLAHLLCYLDVRLGTDMVYDNYVLIIQLVALGQILAFYDTMVCNFRRLEHWVESLRLRGSRNFRTASGCRSILHNPGSPHIQTGTGAHQTNL